MSTVPSISKLAEALGVTRPSLRSWMAQAGFPGGTKGPWDVEKVQRYLRANRLGPYRLNGPTPDDDVGEEGGDDLHALRCRKMRAEALKLELDNLERQGRLSDPSEQARLFGMACAAINTGLENLKARCRPKMVGLKDDIEVDEVLTEEIAILINHLREWRCPDDEQGYSKEPN